MPRRTAEMSDYLCGIRGRIPLSALHNDPEYRDDGIPSLDPLRDVRELFRGIFYELD